MMWPFRSNKVPDIPREIPAPKRALAVRSFAAAQVDRLLAGWRWDGGFSPAEISSGLATIRSRSREMAKNNSHLKRWLQLNAVNIVGEGFALKSTPHDGFPGSKDYRLDEKAAKFIEWHFWRWCMNRDWCDVSGRLTMPEMDRLNVKTWKRDGEYFILVEDAPMPNPYGISLRVIRPDACDEFYNTDKLPNGNMVRCGVELDPATFRPVAYYMHTKPENAYVISRSGPLVRIPASRVIHGFTKEDEAQPRGVPGAHAALIKMKMLDEYDRSELTAARDEACSVRTYFAPKGDEEEIADLTTEENADVANALTAEKEPGQSEVLPIGWKQEIHTPQHPNRELTAFKASMLKDAACGLGVEYSNFANDWAGVSFSSVRVGTISERDMYIVDQNDYIAQNKSPVFLAWLRSFLTYAISGGLPIAKFEKFSEHEIRGRRWMWVDPMKDMSAAVVAVEHGWKTNTDVASDLGTDYGDNLETISRESQMRAANGLAEVPAATLLINTADKGDDDENKTKK
jgi:lambda family phage portal protein